MTSGVVVVLGIVLPRGDRAGVPPTPAGGVGVAVGCTVLQTWRDGISWALQVRVLHVSAVTGHVAIPDPLNKVPACALRRFEGRVEVPDPSRGVVRASGC
jgi:hypothetical protein